MRRPAFAGRLERRGLQVAESEAAASWFKTRFALLTMRDGKLEVPLQTIGGTLSSALSPSRQIKFLKLLRKMDRLGRCQVVMATYAPIPMAYPGARSLRPTKYGLDPVTLQNTDHVRLMREFYTDREAFLDMMMEDET